ncbi:MAG: hypothetical protein KF742_07365 [Cryobacterium sp.]|nr:hypothetical protein [Cryobacterium sp.]MBX3357984.1 hypothetical protein [Phycisphaeraceae bacterium]
MTAPVPERRARRVLGVVWLTLGSAGVVANAATGTMGAPLALSIGLVACGLIGVFGWPTAAGRTGGTATTGSEEAERIEDLTR